MGNVSQQPLAAAPAIAARGSPPLRHRRRGAPVNHSTQPRWPSSSSLSERDTMASCQQMFVDLPTSLTPLLALLPLLLPLLLALPAAAAAVGGGGGSGWAAARSLAAARRLPQHRAAAAGCQEARGRDSCEAMGRGPRAVCCTEHRGSSKRVGKTVGAVANSQTKRRFRFA